MYSLETSLVEWKHGILEELGDVHIVLGNFLSGMETKNLGEMLETMASLGNFLSGMETPSSSLHPGPCPSLGNFLSGMETSRQKC